MKKCGSTYKRNERYTLKELKAIAKARGIKGYSTMNMDQLCAILYGGPPPTVPAIAPTVPAIAPTVPVLKKCGSKYKRGERYTLVELKAIASERGMKGYSSMNMDDLCRALNLMSATPTRTPTLVVEQYESPDTNGVVFRKGFNLLPHQREVIHWMNTLQYRNGLKGGILQLDMGLGKTLISLYWILMSRRLYNTPFLVVCDKSLIDTWVSEANKFFGDRIKFFVFYNGYNKLDSVRRSDYEGADFVITTYNTIKIISEPYHKDIKSGLNVKNSDDPDSPRDGPKGMIYTRWAGIFADEAQAFTNPTTKAFVSMMSLSSDESWCLTGTPIRNSDKDMYSLMRFCGLNTITHPKAWDLVYYRTRRLYEYVKSMDYIQAKIKLPDIIEETIIVDMDRNQRIFYNYYEDLFREFAWMYAQHAKEEHALRMGRPLTRQELGGVQVNFSLILALFTRMRQISIIPRIAWQNSKEVHNAINDNTVNKMSNDMKEWIRNPNSTAYANSAKIKRATKIIGKILTESQDKILVFSSFRQVLEMYEKVLKRVFPDTGIAMLNGEQTVEERTRNINYFKTGPARIFLITFKTGSQGLTLVEANHVIPLDPWWSPTVYAQAIARAHRIGQKQGVFVYNILVKDSIETRIMKICSKKQATIKQFLGDEGEDVSLKLDFKQIVEIMTAKD